MDEITFLVDRDEESGTLIASWDDPGGGGITTQVSDLGELQERVREAVACHFDSGEIPGRIRLHFLTDPIVVAA